MKVLHLIDGPGWSGGVEQTLLLAKGLEAAGIPSEIGCHVRNETLLREAAAAGVRITGFEEDGRLKPVNYRRALRLAASARADVVIAHKPRSALYALLARRVLRRSPRVVVVRRVSRPISALSSRTKYRWPDRVVAVSRSVAATLAAAGLPREKIRVIPSGVDLGRFRPRPEERARVRSAWGAGEHTFVLVQVANFTAKKGHRFLMEALSRLPARNGFRLVLAGHHTDGAACRELAASFGIAELVLGLGMRRDVETLLAGADLFTFPSVPGIEAIAGSVLQAMASGLPVVASSVGGIPEYVVDAHTGWLVPPGDVEAWTRALERVTSLPSPERARVALAGMEAVRTEYSIERTVASYVSLLGELDRARIV